MTFAPVFDIKPSTVNAVHTELENALSRYNEDQLRKGFVVVEPGRIVFRRPPE